MKTGKWCLTPLLQASSIRYLNLAVAAVSIAVLAGLVFAYLGTSRREILRETSLDVLEHTRVVTGQILNTVRPVAEDLNALARTLDTTQGTADLEQEPAGYFLRLAARGARAHGFVAPGGKIRSRGEATPELERLAVSACRESQLPAAVSLGPGTNHPGLSPGPALLMTRPVVGSEGRPLGCLFVEVPLAKTTDFLEDADHMAGAAFFLAAGNWDDPLPLPVPGQEGYPAELVSVLRGNVARALDRPEGSPFLMEAGDNYLGVVAESGPGSGLQVAAVLPRPVVDGRFRDAVALFAPLPLAGLFIIIVTAAFINRLNENRARAEEQLNTVEAKRRYRELVEMTYDGIMVLGADGTIEAANESAAGLLGVPAAEIPGRRLQDFLRGGECALAPSEPGADHVLLACTFVRPDGHERRGEAVRKGFTEGGAEKQVIVIRDVTERELSQERQRNLERMAALGNLAAKISHEINNPLTVVLSLSELGTAKADDAKARTYFEAIHHEADRITAITRNYLSLSKPAASERSVEDPAEIVREIVRFFDSTGQAKGVDLVVDAPQDLPRVRVERLKIFQALLNLMVNAVQAMEKVDGPRLTLTALAADDDAGTVISVADNGAGIPPENLERIFESFFSTKGDTGTGLGLAIVKEIVEEGHGGRLTVESTVGQGTVFKIFLPAVHAGGEPEPAQS